MDYDKENLIKYLQVINNIAEANPDVRDKLNEQALTLYTQYLDANRPDVKASQYLGGDAVSALTNAGVDITGLANQGNATKAMPYLQQFMDLQGQSQSGELGDTESKQLDTLKYLLENPIELDTQKMYDESKQPLSKSLFNWDNLDRLKQGDSLGTVLRDAFMWNRNQEDAKDQYFRNILGDRYASI